MMDSYVEEKLVEWGLEKLIPTLQGKFDIDLI